MRFFASSVDKLGQDKRMQEIVLELTRSSSLARPNELIPELLRCGSPDRIGVHVLESWDAFCKGKHPNSRNASGEFNHRGQQMLIMILGELHYKPAIPHLEATAKALSNSNIFEEVETAKMARRTIEAISQSRTGNDATAAPVRLVSLDAYRGFVMLAMASSGFGLAAACTNPDVLQRFDNSGAKTAWRWVCGQLAFHTTHMPWAGCSFWDLIQPSFMFMVGVALPFSFASRASLGQSGFMQFLHVLKRSLVLILLGVFLRSNGAAYTNYTFVDVLSQIGLGYPIVWLMLRRGTVLQLLVCAAILGGYWYAFYQYPAPGPGFDPTSVGLPADWPTYHGLAAHWNKNTNWATAMDQQLLNLLPQYNKSGELTRFQFHSGGYQTLNFIPAIVTMIFGLMAGELLRGTKTPQDKTRRLIGTGLLALASGLALDPRLVSNLSLDWTLCPIVKVIWTPSWTLFSTGITLWMLAGFYWVIDVNGWKAWAFPLTIVGMNSIAMYVGASLLKPWIGQTLKTHFGKDLFEFPGGNVAAAAATLLVLWLMCLWMYRRKIFVRI